MVEKESSQDSSSKRLTKAELEKMLIDNFVDLQKVLTNLSVKFEDLSEKISKLLELFEVSAKSFAEKQATGAGEIDEELISKLDSLLEQNKTIAKGITLIEGKIKENSYDSDSRGYNGYAGYSS